MAGRISSSVRGPDRGSAGYGTDVCGTENGIGKIIQSAESADHKTGKTWPECESAVWSEGRRKFFGGDVEWNLNHMHIRHTASKKF